MRDTLTDVFLSERRSLIWRLLQIVRDRQTAEDLAQETYLRTSRALDTGKISHLDAFLHQTARNLAIDYLRQRKNRGEVVTEGLDDTTLQNVPSNALSAEEIAIERERFAAFRAALSSLPERAQQVVVLSRIEGWSQARIAERLGVTERTVHSDLKLALTHCRDILEKLQP
ncbi:RNA polymerase sigma factor [Roseibium aggregatum]|uniref:RNA polymerase sigma factor n=1 Tax=Roseibium aggregatum TaxID=187304 RepID=UPI001AD8B1C7|nr:RNA polymerase sigma factor [Roseibium aggregatum]